MPLVFARPALMIGAAITAGIALEYSLKKDLLNRCSQRVEVPDDTGEIDPSVAVEVDPERRLVRRNRPRLMETETPPEVAPPVSNDVGERLVKVQVEQRQ